MKQLMLGSLAGLLATALLLPSAGRLAAADKPSGGGDTAKPRTEAPAAYAVESNKSEHICWRDKEGHILELWTRYGDNAGWHLRDLTKEANATRAAGDPAAYYWRDNKTEHVVYRGEDENIHEMYLPDNGKWAQAELSNTAGAPKAAGNPAAYVEESNKTQHVIYRTGDGDLIELYAKYGDNNGWRKRNLTTETKAPRAAGDPTGFYWHDTKSQHVFFRSEDGGLHELYMNPNGQWAHGTVGAEAKAPKAAGDPAAFPEPGNKTEHVVYRSSDGDIIEVVGKYGDNRGWETHNLSSETKAPKAAGDPDGYVLAEGVLGRVKTQHIVFRGEDGDIHELYLGGPDSKWQHANLSGEAKAPRAASDPAGYVVEANVTQHVVYRSMEGGIYELYNALKSSQPGWHGNDLSKTKVEGTSGSGGTGTGTGTNPK